MKKTTLRMCQTALVAAVALVLSFVESLIPTMPFMLPGMKLGLSNIATMFALTILDLPAAIFVCVIKSLFALLMRGTVSFLMSFTGGILSTFIMFVLLNIKKPKFGYIGIGVSGAFFHNFGQIIIAFIFTDATVFAYFSILSLVSIVTGTITAVVLFFVIPPITKIKLFSQYTVDKT